MGKTITTGFLSTTIGKIPVNSSVKCNPRNYTSYSSRFGAYVVMHYTGNDKDTALGNVRYFSGPNRGASAHFFVDENNIYQSVGMKDKAWHCGAHSYRHGNCRNENSIGIEMCTSGNSKVSEKTKQNAAQLCAYICKKLEIGASEVDKYVLRHYDVTGKCCPAQMATANNAEWAAFKAEVKKILKGSTTKSPKDTGSTKVTSKASTYKVKVTADVLNVRESASASAKKIGEVKKGEVYTISKVKKDWGKLKNKEGWINLKYTSKM